MKIIPIYAYGARKPKIDPSAWIFPSADIIGKVQIGANVYIGAGVVIRGDYGTIKIGDGSAIEENVTIHARPGGNTIIEKNVTVGHAAMLHNCTLREGCIIGMNSVVSDYAEVGEWAIVAEGSVVKSKDKIPPNMIAAGVPAIIKGPVKESHKRFWAATKEIYQDLAKKYPKKLKLIERKIENKDKDVIRDKDVIKDKDIIK
ncbi:MAG: gamma carbonic anhydrase family protein [Promethearchaeota archaeon]